MVVEMAQRACHVASQGEMRGRWSVTGGGEERGVVDGWGRDGARASSSEGTKKKAAKQKSVQMSSGSTILKA